MLNRAEWSTSTSSSTSSEREASWRALKWSVCQICPANIGPVPPEIPRTPDPETNSAPSSWGQQRSPGCFW